jgi:flagellar biosynthesis protein FliP
VSVRWLLFISLGLLWASPAFAEIDPEAQRALTWVAVGALAPLLAVAATAFAKASVVLGILRGGLGSPGALPAPVITALAAVLALLVMAPVGRQMVEATAPAETGEAVVWTDTVARGWPVLERFLTAHTRPQDLEAVQSATATLSPGTPPGPPERLAAFLVSELTAAFSLGVLLLLPFLVVDLLVANTLVTVGFTQLSPMLVALPFKLLLFLAVDGWGLLVRGFVAGYA